jgi:hypothetical protein
MDCSCSPVDNKSKCNVAAALTFFFQGEKIATAVRKKEAVVKTASSK